MLVRFLGFSQNAAKQTSLSTSLILRSSELVIYLFNKLQVKQSETIYMFLNSCHVRL